MIRVIIFFNKYCEAYVVLRVCVHVLIKGSNKRPVIENAFNDL